MKLVVPYIGELQGPDARMLRLPSFSGYRVKHLLWQKVADHAEFLEKSVPDQCSCFVRKPAGDERMGRPSGIPADLVSFLLSRFPHLLVYGLRVDAFDSEMIAALSRGRLKSVDAIDGECSAYTIAKDSKRCLRSVFGTFVRPGESRQRSCPVPQW